VQLTARIQVAIDSVVMNVQCPVLIPKAVDLPRKRMGFGVKELGDLALVSARRTAHRYFRRLRISWTVRDSQILISVQITVRSAAADGIQPMMVVNTMPREMPSRVDLRISSQSAASWWVSTTRSPFLLG
jgi:hypothetical protein